MNIIRREVVHYGDSGDVITDRDYYGRVIHSADSIEESEEWREYHDNGNLKYVKYCGVFGLSRIETSYDESGKILKHEEKHFKRPVNKVNYTLNTIRDDNGKLRGIDSDGYELFEAEDKGSGIILFRNKHFSLICPVSRVD